MSLIADEIIQFSSVLRMAYNLLTGRNYLKRKKFREKEKLVAVTLPFSDLAFAADTIPVFPIRMHEFEISQYLTYLGSASSIFGWNTVSNFLGFIRNLGINEVSKIVDDIIEDVIDVINKKYNEMSIITGELGENILKHSGKGKITIVFDDSEHPYIETISENVGLLPKQAKVDGISTKRSLGIGLGIVHRLSDGVYYEQDGDILRIRSVKYCSNFPARSEVAVLSYPVMSKEKSNGDFFASTHGS